MKCAKKPTNRAQLADGWWKVTLDPDAMMVFKRLFPRANTGQVGTLLLQDNPAMCADLDWFAKRYEVEFEPRAHLDRRVSEYVESQSLVQRIMADGYEPPMFDLAIPAREYQRQGTALALEAKKIIIGDDAGTGKSVIAFGLLSDKRTRPAVYVTLTALPNQVQRMAKRFLPGITTHVVKHGTPYDFTRKPRTRKNEKIPFPDVLIMSYSKLAGWADHLAAMGFKMVIFDECHELRHPKTAKYEAATGLARSTEYVCGMSVGPASIVELRGGPFGRGWVGPIEHATQIAHQHFEIDRLGSYIVARASGVESRGWTGERFGWKQVKSFVSHPCERSVTELRVAGDDLIATDDHSVYVANADSSITERATCDVAPGDVCMVDDGHGWEDGAAHEEPVDVVALMRGRPKVQVVVDLTGITRAKLGVSQPMFWKMRHAGRHGPRMPLALYERHAAQLPQPTGVYFSQCPADRRCDARVMLSTWAYVLGFYLGDGWIDGWRVNFAVETARVPDFVAAIRAMPGIELEPFIDGTQGDSAEVRCTSTMLVAILMAVMGKHKCFNKSIPGEWILSWPRAARLELLRGLVDSDGHIAKRDGRRVFTTTSLNLARGTISLLRSLGVVGYLYKRPACDGGVVDGRQIKGRRPSYVVQWSGFAVVGDDRGGRGLQRRRGRRSKGRFNEGIARKTRHVAAPAFVYDLEMEGHPSFTANGVLVHNSATPVFGMGSQIFYVVNIVREGALGSREEFVREWCDTEKMKDDKPAIKDPDALGLYLRKNAIMLRRTREEVGQFLPPLQRLMPPIDIDEKPLQDVQAQAIRLATHFLKKGITGLSKMKAGAELTIRLRMATGIAKAPHVAQFVRMLVEQGEKVLVYAWHREVHDILMARLNAFKPVFYTGAESQKQKEDSLRRFTDSKAEDASPILVMSLRSGAGIDGLQYAGCSVIVFAELDWSPATHEQAECRIQRFTEGVAVPILAYYPVAMSGSDPPLIELLGLKEDQLVGIRDPNTPRVQKKVDTNMARERVMRIASSYLREHGVEVPDMLPSNDGPMSGSSFDAEREELNDLLDHLETEQDVERKPPARRVVVAADPWAARAASPPKATPPDPWLARAQQRTIKR